jgi:L-iditol 2-dehydrogenase
MKMKAAVLYGIGDLRFEEVPLPKIKKGEALVRVKACGICSSDIARIMEKGTYSFPLIPGHELSGEVANIKGDISRFKEETKSVNQNGDRVVVAPLLPCYKCPHCQIGEYNLCDDYDYLGSRCNGGFAEYVKAPQENLIKIPPGVSFEEAALTEPTSVALHALRQAKMGVGDKVAILGTGPIGIILAQWARILGASEVYLVDVVEEKLRVAQQYSFTETVNASKEDTVKSILEKTGQRGVDVSIEAAGNPITFKQSIQVVRKGGKVVFLGNMRGEVTLPDELVSSILRKELTMYGTWNSRFTHLPRNEWAATLHFIKVGKLRVKPLITHRFELKEAEETFRMMYKGKEFFNKVMFLA